jgi:hypothetical protein
MELGGVRERHVGADGLSVFKLEGESGKESERETES